MTVLDVKMVDKYVRVVIFAFLGNYQIFIGYITDTFHLGVFLSPNLCDAVVNFFHVIGYLRKLDFAFRQRVKYHI